MLRTKMRTRQSARPAVRQETLALHQVADRLAPGRGSSTLVQRAPPRFVLSDWRPKKVPTVTTLIFLWVRLAVASMPTNLDNFFMHIY
jgi:hypothetical protein